MDNIIDQDILLDDIEYLANTARKKYKEGVNSAKSVVGGFTQQQVHISYHESEIINSKISMQKTFINALVGNDTKYNNNPRHDNAVSWDTYSYKNKVKALKNALNANSFIYKSHDTSFAEQVVQLATKEILEIIKNENNLKNLITQTLISDESIINKKLKILNYVYFNEQAILINNMGALLNKTLDHLRKNAHEYGIYETEIQSGGVNSKFKDAQILLNNNWKNIFDSFLVGDINNVKKIIASKNTQIVSHITSSFYEFSLSGDNIKKIVQKIKNEWEKSISPFQDFLSLLDEYNESVIDKTIESFKVDEFLNNKSG